MPMTYEQGSTVATAGAGDFSDRQARVTAIQDRLAEIGNAYRDSASRLILELTALSKHGEGSAAMIVRDEPWETTAFDAMALTTALRVSPLPERELVERWLSARAARSSVLPA